MKKKVLFITPHRLDRSPSQRFRFEQYISILEENGYECTMSYLITPWDDKYFYKPGNFGLKFWILLKGFMKRMKDVMRASQYDLIFVQREAYFTGTTFFERQFAKKSKLIFDFDDAIFKFDISPGNRLFSFMKNPSKTADIIKVSDMVFAGNDYLKDYALQFSDKVKVVPTTIDTVEYAEDLSKKRKDKICIGWSGSITTIVHFQFAEKFLKPIKEKYGDQVYIKVIGDGSYVNEELDVKGSPWRKDTELADLNEIQIGIMPLPDDEWAKGKCGLKGIQYMSLGIPTMMSPVGVNSEIIQDGENGFLATEVDEWVEKLSRLIDDEALRLKLGKAGQQTVLDKYSVEACKSLYLDYFKELTN